MIRALIIIVIITVSVIESRLITISITSVIVRAMVIFITIP